MKKELDIINRPSSINAPVKKKKAGKSELLSPLEVN